jgi:hypothetical protein
MARVPRTRTPVLNPDDDGRDPAPPRPATVEDFDRHPPASGAVNELAQSREPFADPPFESFPLNGLLCPECNGPQRETDGGASCANGHGGLDGVKPPTRKPLAEPTSTPETRRAAREEKANEAAGVGPNVFPSGDEGDSVSATAAECLYTPKPYNSFRVGPFTVTTRVRAGETHADAGRRAKRAADKLFEESFAERLAAFIAEMRKVDGAVR